MKTKDNLSESCIKLFMKFEVYYQSFKSYFIGRSRVRSSRLRFILIDCPCKPHFSVVLVTQLDCWTHSRSARAFSSFSRPQTCIIFLENMEHHLLFGNYKINADQFLLCFDRVRVNVHPRPPEPPIHLVSGKIVNMTWHLKRPGSPGGRGWVNGFQPISACVVSCLFYFNICDTVAGGFHVMSSKL